MARPKGRGRGRGSRGGRGRGRGRTKKMVIESGSEEDVEQMDNSDNGETHATEEEESNAVDDVEESTTEVNKDNSVEFNIDDDISQLVPPTFSTISKGPPQPMLELTWDHQYAPMGERVTSPNIHMCIACRLPIRLYGRLIPCKHVFCYGCAVKQGDRCSCCDDRVTRIEKAPLGNVYMCLHGGIQFGYEGCRRTYLSHRDLQAHFNHRHKPRSSGGSSGPSSSMNEIMSPGSHRDRQSSSNNSSSMTTPTSSHHPHPSMQQYSRPNLISVPLSTPSASSSRSSSSMKDNHNNPDRFDRKSSASYSRSSSGGSGYSSSFRPY